MMYILSLISRKETKYKLYFTVFFAEMDKIILIFIWWSRRPPNCQNNPEKEQS